MRRLRILTRSRCKQALLIESLPFSEWIPKQELQRQMSDWYARYKARTAGVKEALKPILESFGRPGGSSLILDVCMRLKSEALRALGELPLWTSPDGNVNRSLRTAYQTLAQAGKACEDGRGADTRKLIDRATAQLSEAARYLQPYEMTP